MRFTVLLALVGCVDPLALGDGKVGADDTGDADMPVEGTPASDGFGDTCPAVPDGCVSLAEAVDRGWALVEMDVDASVLVENVGDVPICLDGFNTFISHDSQDATAGNYLPDTAAPGTSFTLGAEGGADTTRGEWWCVELAQATAVASYTFDGAEGSPPVTHFIADDTDVDGDGVEDHEDDSAFGTPQAQENIWDYEDDNPVIIVGRESNYLQVDVGQDVDVTVRVTNIGRQAGHATVRERVPAGYVPAGFDPAPTGSTAESDGSTTYTFSVSLDAGADPTDVGGPSTYDVAEIHYSLSVRPSGCAGRTTAFGPEADWTDDAGDSWTSAGAALVLECCDDGDGNAHDPWP
jgi:hypothetical protein